MNPSSPTFVNVRSLSASPTKNSPSLSGDVRYYMLHKGYKDMIQFNQRKKPNNDTPSPFNPGTPIPFEARYATPSLVCCLFTPFLWVVMVSNIFLFLGH